jgi:hypothetical protein
MTFSDAEAVTFEQSNGREIVCSGGATGSADIGHHPNALTGVDLTFEGCVEPRTGAACEARSGAPSGDVTSEELRGEIGFVSGSGTSSPAVGLSLTPVSKPPQKSKTPFMTQISCDAESTTGKLLVEIGKAKNTAISTIGPLDMTTSSFSESFAASAPGIQEITKFETGAAVTLDSHFEPLEGKEATGPCAIEAGLTSTTAIPVEIKAVG